MEKFIKKNIDYKTIIEIVKKVLYISVGLMLVSVCSELILKRSLMGAISPWFRDCMVDQFSSFADCNAIFEVVKAVGFVSVLIGWTLTGMDNEELGVRGSQRKEGIVNNFSFVVLLYVVSFVICIWASKTNNLETAIISLITLSCSCVLLWLIVYQIVLSLDLKRQGAIEYYQSRLENPRDQLNTLYKMAENLNRDSLTIDSFVEAFVNGLCSYAGEMGTDKECSVQIEALAGIWNLLALQEKYFDYDSVCNAVLRKIKLNIKLEQDSKAFKIITLSFYLTWWNRQGKPNSEDQVNNIIFYIQNKANLFSSANLSAGYDIIVTVACLTGWYYFLENVITSEAAMKVKTVNKEYAQSFLDEDDMLVTALLSKCIPNFNKELYDKAKGFMPSSANEGRGYDIQKNQA